MNPIKKRTKNYTKIPTEINSMPELSHTAFRLYVLACGWDSFYFSYVKIRKYTGMSNTTISRAIKELIRFNMISYKPGYGFKGSKSVSNEYQLNGTFQYRKATGSSIANGVLPVSQMETINDKLNNTLKGDLAKSVVGDYEEPGLRMITREDVIDVAKSSKGQPASSISKRLKGRLPEDFAETFVSVYLSSVDFTEDSCAILENLGSILGKRDSIVRAISNFLSTSI